nr:hypothetical protein [Cyanobacteria bacterium RUI128]
MAKKKYTDVFVTDGIAQGTKGNDVFHVTTSDVNTVIRTTITTKKINSKGKVVTTTTVTKGSDV